MMKKMFLSLISLGILFTSCNDEDQPTTSNLTLNLSGLEALGPNFVYEGWIIVNNQPISTGRFSSVTFPQTFLVNAGQLANASMFVLTIEPTVDADPGPAATKLLSGNFSGSLANVNSDVMVANFSNATGKYILATPTDTNDTNEESGVWFLDNSSGSPVTGLNLPTLAAGWKYEGWVVLGGQVLSTGTFLDASMADDNAATSVFKGTANNGPNYPGEDFLRNAPSGLTFPTDLRGTTIVISVEPSPDNSSDPFTLKPLAHQVPANAMGHTAITMGNGPVVSLSGTVSR